MQCPSCGFSVRRGDNFCSNCGVRLSRGEAEIGATKRPCKACGTALPPGSNFCGFCGVVEPHSAPAVSVIDGGLAAENQATREIAPVAISVPRAKPVPSPVEPSTAWPDLGDALEEISFLRDQGLTEDVRQAIDELHEEYPGHPDLPPRVAARPAPSPPPPPARPAAPARPGRPGGGFSLGDLDEDEIDAALEDFGPDDPPTERVPPKRVPPHRVLAPAAEAKGPLIFGSEENLAEVTQDSALPVIDEDVHAEFDEDVPEFDEDSGPDLAAEPPLEVEVEDALVDYDLRPDFRAVEHRAQQPIEPILLEMLGPEGEVMVRRVIEPGEAFDIGRDAEPPWGDDEHMEPLHAELLSAPGGLMVIDRFDGGGPVFRQLDRPERMRDGDEFRVGQSLVVYEEDDYGSGRLRVQINGEGPIDTVEVVPTGLMLGREQGDVIFPEDTYVSGEHCRVVSEGPHLYMEDLGSSNGTYVRVRPSEPVEFGSLLLMGQTQVRVGRASSARRSRGTPLSSATSRD